MRRRRPTTPTTPTTPPAATATDIPLARPTTERLYTVGALVERGLGDLRQRSLGTLRTRTATCHIFDAGAHRMVVVDGEGNHLRTVGTQGEGPGRDRERARGRGARGRANGGLRLRHPGRVRDLRWRRPVPSERDLRHQQGRAGRVDASACRTGAWCRWAAPGTGSPRRARRSDHDEPREDDHLRDIHVFSLDGEEQRVLYRALEPAADRGRRSDRGGIRGGRDLNELQSHARLRARAAGGGSFPMVASRWSIRWPTR